MSIKLNQLRDMMVQGGLTDSVEAIDNRLKLTGEVSSSGAKAVQRKEMNKERGNSNVSSNKLRAKKHLQKLQ